MIFITVGVQLPFDRLLKAIDENIDVFKGEELLIQRGNSAYQFQSNKSNVQIVNELSPKAYKQAIQNCRLIISHAGMGSIITSINNHKPIIILPRLTKYGEHRNDHQLYTSEEFRDLDSVYVANNDSELVDLFEKISTITGREHDYKINVDQSFLKKLREFIES